ncbi:hypothetical protein Daus18300_009068 [Diaporthe australafricana]|uniref:Fungal specific transcription factor domain-containing protein n=1 Tax=Diaporthe australafricana TaxID=127596 RepID=A0ABR3WFT9_9PEZI
MHANRPFLLGAVSTPAERGGPTPLDDSVEECLGAARAALETLDSMVKDSSLFYALWWTPYVTFCALAVVYVWEIQNRESGDAADLLKLAERCHNHLELSNATDSPSRRYGIILKELQQEAKYQSTVLQSDQPGQPERSANIVTGTSLAEPMDASLHASDELEIGQPSVMASSLGGVGFAGQSRLLEAWQTTDWLDLDSSAFGPFPDFEDSSAFWNPEGL